jgi:hypothetical protein
LTTTAAPSPANVLAMTAPVLIPAPVTIATSPAKAPLIKSPAIAFPLSAFRSAEMNLGDDRTKPTFNPRLRTYWPDRGLAKVGEAKKTIMKTIPAIRRILPGVAIRRI